MGKVNEASSSRKPTSKASSLKKKITKETSKKQTVKASSSKTKTGKVDVASSSKMKTAKISSPKNQNAIASSSKPKTEKVSVKITSRKQTSKPCSSKKKIPKETIKKQAVMASSSKPKMGKVNVASSSRKSTSKATSCKKLTAKSSHAKRQITKPKRQLSAYSPGKQKNQTSVLTLNEVDPKWKNKYGWINEPLDVGCLVRKFEEPNRVVFIFLSGGKEFIAWSAGGSNTTNKWGNVNHTLLKEGCSYILNGSIKAESESKTKYFRSFSTSSKLCLFFGDITVIQETVNPNTELLSLQITTLQQVSQQIQNSKYFTEDIKNVEICDARFYRYMGCEKCSTAIHYPDDKDGKYYCGRCMKKSGPKNRKVCLVLRNMVLKDSEGTIVGGFVCFSNGYEKLVKAAEVKKICMSKTDILAREKAKTLIGLVVNVRIKHQRATGSTKGPNVPRRIAEVLSVINKIQTSEDDLDDNCSENEDNSTCNNISELVQPSFVPSSNDYCQCVDVDDDDDDENSNEGQNETPSKRIRLSSVENISVDNDENNIMPFYIDTEGQYPMTSKPVGFALIVNMNFKKFKNHRRGAEKDVEALKSLFKSLKITVNVHQDITAQELKSKVVEFKKMLSENNASCCFVVFMSHGILYHVKMADEQRVNVFTDIMDQFSEKNFREFCGKPKIFIFQACSNFNENDLTEGCVSFLRDSTDMYSDMLYVTASLPGIKSKRNPNKGSYFIQTFVEVLKQMAGKKDLEKILFKIQEEMKDMRVGKEKRERNIPMYSPILFRRFNFRLD